MNLGDTGCMSTQASTPHVLRRVAVRAAVGVWRHRTGVLLSAIFSVALGSYITLTWTGSVPLSLASGPLAPRGVAAVANTDCADTAIAAIADKSPVAAQRAYQCMDATFQQRVTEQAFVQQMQAQNIPNVSKLARVGDYHTPAGGTMVYYALDGANQSVGYIVYLGQNGKVVKVE
jgi:hypothetical protein